MAFTAAQRKKALKTRKANAKLRREGKLPAIVRKPKSDTMSLTAVDKIMGEKTEKNKPGKAAKKDMKHEIVILKRKVSLLQQLLALYID